MKIQTNKINMENKEAFRKRLAPYFSPSDLQDIYLAYILAKFGHRAQVRKEVDANGKPTRYFEHVRRAALILMDELKIMDKVMIIALLHHDSLEDTEDLTEELLEHCYGSDVVSIVKFLSKNPKEGYYDRLSSCQDWRVLLLKACDRLDNLRSLMVPGTSVEFQAKQVKETKEIFFPLLDRLLELGPKNYSQSIVFIRDEIRRLVEKYSTLLEIKAEYTLHSKT